MLRGPFFRGHSVVHLLQAKFHYAIQVAVADLVSDLSYLDMSR